MQFKKPLDSPASPELAGESARPRNRRPQWLVDWIAERGQYVKLACGHLSTFADADTTACLIRAFPGIEMLCDKCEHFSEVVESISLFEYMGIAKPEESSTPLF